VCDPLAVFRHTPTKPQQGCLIWPATFCRIGLCRSGRDGSHAKGVELLLELLVDGASENASGFERTNATRAGPHALRLRDQPAHQVVFIPVRSADVLWRTVAFAGDAAWIRDIRIRLQNGSAAGHAPSHHQSRTTYSNSVPTRLYKRDDPLLASHHDCARRPRRVSTTLRQVLTELSEFFHVC